MKFYFKKTFYNSRILICSFFVLVLSTASLDAQYMEASRKSKLIVGSYLYDYNESELFFKGTQEGLTSYRKSIKKFETGKVWGYISLASYGLGVGLIYIDQHQGSCDFICITTGQAIGIISAGLVFPLAGTIGLFKTWAGKSDKRDAVQFYNDYNGFSEPPEDETSLSFGMTQNGIGFVFNF